MKQFLSSVADAFFEKENLEDYLFVLPNRRSCSFLKNFFAKKTDSSFILPRVKPISDFIAEQADLIEIDKVELLFALYNVYRDIKGLEKSEIDKFLYWGDIILNDFSDIDMYMADAEGLYKNLKNLKEINADYLTEEQSKVIQQYWGEFRAAATGEHLWKDNSKNYGSLWSILFELYTSFKESLINKRLGYSGLVYRTAAERITEKGVDDFDFKNIVFVGFSTLSTSELSIFRHFKKIGIGDYYWDFNSPVFKDKNNAAVKFVATYKNEFKSKEDIAEEKITDMPNITVVSVPSGSGQAKILPKILEEIYGNDDIEVTEKEPETAIVLPEEKYLNSVLHSIPKRYRTLNVTMGFPLSQSVISSFFGMLNTMLSRRRNIDGKVCFYYEDVNSMLSHQFVVVNWTKVEELKKVIVDKHYFFVPKHEIVSRFQNLTGVFDSDLLVAEGKGIEYIEGVFNVLEQIMFKVTNKQEHYFFNQYRITFERVKNIAQKYGVNELNGKSYLYLICRLLSGSLVAFQGEPLEGIQIMGILETRLLDFKNMIILSMNEKVFPSKSYTKSFIPAGIRTAFGLATRKNQDSMYAYYFYRMISRAENVFLLYDSRVQGISNGEESRFISQLEKLYMKGTSKIKRQIWSYNISSKAKPRVIVEKTPEIMEKLNKYKEGGKMHLSASSLSNYLKCSLMFYLGTVENIKEEDDIDDFIDSATFGSVVHKALENIYETVKGKAVTTDFFDSLFANGEKNLDKQIFRAINVEYVHDRKEENELDPKEITADIEIIFNTVKFYLRPLLEYDRELKNFTYIDSEHRDEVVLRIPNALPFNFKFIIDRLDRVDGKLRIVDYKTGSDSNEFSDIEKLFNGDFKAIFQLMLYSYAYSEKENLIEDIEPNIYKLRTIHSNPENSFGIYEKVGIGKREKFCSYLSKKDMFLEKLSEVINEIFDPNVPFQQAKTDKPCVYCPFSKLCAKNN